MASLFGDYKPGAISSFLLSGGGGEKPPSSKKQQRPEPPTAPKANKPAAAPALLFDEATRARFQPQAPLPGLVAPLPKRAREGEDGESTAKKTKKGKERPPRPLKSEKEAARRQKQLAEGSIDRAPLVLAQPPKTPSSTPAPPAPKQQQSSSEPAAAPAAAAVTEGQDGKPSKKQKKKEKQQQQQQQQRQEEPAVEAATLQEQELEGEAAASSDNDDDDADDQARAEDAEEKERRTVFVGNVPNTFTKPRLCALFKEFGPIESVRFRSMALAGAKVGDHGNQRLVKKVSANKRLLSEAKDAFNAYLVFAREESAAAALAANNRVVEGHHLRVDRVGAAATRDPARTVFLGNVPFDATEEEVRAHFAAALAAEGGDGAVEGVRLVRDAETQMGKGFGFVLLQDKATAAAALRLLHDSKLKGRPIRVTTCGKRARKNPDRGSPRVRPKVRPKEKGKGGAPGGASPSSSSSLASSPASGKKPPQKGKGDATKRASFEGRRASSGPGAGAGAAGAGIRLRKRKAAPGAKGKKKGDGKGKKKGGAAAKPKKGKK